MKVSGNAGLIPSGRTYIGFMKLSGIGFICAISYTQKIIQEKGRSAVRSVMKAPLTAAAAWKTHMDA